MLGRLAFFPRANAIRLLAKLAVVSEDFVRARALEAMLRRPPGTIPDNPVNGSRLSRPISTAQHPHPTHLRAPLASRLPDNAWQQIPFDRLTIQGKITAATAMIWRKPETDIHTEVVQRMLPLIDIDQTDSLNTDIVRTIILASATTTWIGQAVSRSPAMNPHIHSKGHAGLAKAIATQVTPLMEPFTKISLEKPGGSWPWLALGSLTFQRFAAPITVYSDPVDDFHKLIVMAKLPSTIPDTDLGKLADSLMGLDAKLQSQKQDQS
ncbi:MAG: hypothetical protein CM1200mP29_04090 [Verrucomicrobiota bacterium]|nr:MAG: hypothetical protein CM1200mP29_04090 [Verrucomicrobiota bacterium]